MSIPASRIEISPLPRHVHFVGVGGVGMSGLALILLDLGISVSGSDAAASPAGERLRLRGADIFSGHAADQVPAQTELLVFSSAVPADNPERQTARRRGLREIRRGEFLAELAARFATVVAIAGSHGKTTTTAMLAHILRVNHVKPGFLVGGEVNDWAVPASAGNGRILVTEVDESDGTQAVMRSTFAAVLNIEDDHSWSVGGVEALEACFAEFAGHAGEVIAWDSPGTRRILAAHPALTLMTGDNIPQELDLPIPGRHNRSNAAVAIALAVRLGVKLNQAILAMKSFPGVGRRMTTHLATPDGRVVLIEDYAHHPTELDATLSGLRETYPRHRLQVIFQPHRFERIKRYGKHFSQLLARADAVTVYEAFAAWVSDSDGADARQIAAAITGIPADFYRGDPAALASRLADSANTGKTLFAVIGAGDVCQLVNPLRQHLIRHELRAMSETLAAHFPDWRIVLDRPWNKLTTLGIGKACPLLLQADNPGAAHGLPDVLKFLSGQSWPVRHLANGSNLVGSDEACLEAVIQLGGEAFGGLTIRGATIVAGAGVSLATLVRAASRAGICDPEYAPLAWIPGTLGGAVRMNAGAGKFTIGDAVLSVCGFSADGTAVKFTDADIAWGYRRSSLPDDIVVTEVVLNFGSGAPDAFHAADEKHGQWRREKQPPGKSAGSVFRGAGKTSAGALIERCGFKNKQIGGCRVSDRHANFILNERGASEADFARMVVAVRTGVFRKTGVNLQLEAKFVNPETQKTVDSCVAPPTVTVLKGGPSAERKISLISGAAVAQALREAGLRVHEIDLQTPCLPEIPADTDVVFPVLHGTFGEDGQLQALLEKAGWPYVGSGPEASRIAMVKSETKAVLEKAGIPTARFLRITSVDAPLPAGLSFPLIVKPDAQGSSVGMTKLDAPEPAAWRQALADALAVDTAALVEEFVRGTEITVGILQGKVLPVCEIVPPTGRIFDYDAKYEHAFGDTRYLCPPENVSEEAQALAGGYALKFYHAIGARDLLRVDFIVDEDGIPYCLEGNAIPGFTASSILPKAAARIGITFPELCARLVAGVKDR